jgi:invasion protein IalB
VGKFMSKFNRFVAYLSVGAAVMFAGSSAIAQLPSGTPPERPQVAPAPAETPQRTTATYGDWVLQCDTTTSSPQKLCEISQVSMVQGKNVPFSQIMVPHPVKGQPVKLVVLVPVNVNFATPMRLVSGDNDPGISIPLTRCIPMGCSTDFSLNEAALKKLLAATGSGKVIFADAAGREVNIPLSFNGFVQAYDALAKQ